MRQLSVILLALTLLFATPASFAGMATRKTTTRECATRHANISDNGKQLISAEKLISILHLPTGHDGKHHDRPRDTSGWEGIVSLCCGVLAFFTVGITAIPAIIFGALGLGKGKKNHGLAIAGLVLGILMVFIVAIAIVAFVTPY